MTKRVTLVALFALKRANPVFSYSIFSGYSTGSDVEVTMDRTEIQLLKDLGTDQHNAIRPTRVLCNNSPHTP